MRKQVLHLLLSLVFSVWLLWALSKELSLAKFVEMMQQVNKELVFAYIVCSLSALLLRALRYRLLLQELSKEMKLPSFDKFLVLSAIRNAFVDLLPARLGELSYVYVLHRLQIPVRTALSTFSFCIVLDVLTLSFLITGFFLIVPIIQIEVLPGMMQLTLGKSLFTVLSFLILLLLVLFIITFYLDRFVELLGRMIRWPIGSERISADSKLARLILSLSSFFLEMADEFRRFQRQGSFLRLFAVTIGLRFLKYLGLFLLLFAVLGQWSVTLSEMKLPLVLLSFISAETAASLPISGLMGFGAYEGVWALVFGLAYTGSQQIPLKSLAFSIHLITQVLGYSLGGSCFNCFSLMEKRKCYRGG